jgi:hypothetical protein
MARDQRRQVGEGGLGDEVLDAVGGVHAWSVGAQLQGRNR